MQAQGASQFGAALLGKAAHSHTYSATNVKAILMDLVTAEPFQYS